MVDGASTSATDNNIEVKNTFKLDSLASIDDIIGELASNNAGKRSSSEILLLRAGVI